MRSVMAKIFMEVEQKVAKFLSLSASQDIAEQLRAKLASKAEFTVLQAFEPNGRLTLAQANNFSVVSRVTAECGGKYVLFVADVAASEHLAFNRDETQIQASANYGLEVLKAMGVEGPHVTVVRSSEYTLDNTEVFLDMVRNSIKIPAKKVQDALPPLGKKEVITCSRMIAPCLQATEIIHLGADIVFAPEFLCPQLRIIDDFTENPPVIVPLPVCINLKGPKAQSPKPDPKNVFFFEDDDQQITQKSNAAFCTDEIKDNPVFQYIAFVVLPSFGEFEFENNKYTAVADFVTGFAGYEKKVLKSKLAEYISKIITPVREHLKKPELASIVAGVAKMSTTQ